MKTIFLLGSIILLGLGAMYVSKQNESEQLTVTKIESADMFRKASVSDLQFSYKTSPDGYVLIRDNTMLPEDIVSSATIFNEKDYAELKQGEVPGEYPPSITVSAFKNESSLTPLEWAQANSMASNIELKQGEVSTIHIEGVEGISYKVSGLYMIEVYVFAYDNQMYMLTGEYFETDDQIYTDFTKLIASLRFSN